MFSKKLYILMLKIFSLRTLIFSGTFLLTFCALTSFGQSQINGRVVSSDELVGLPSATVIVKGSTIGTVTDIDGRFSLIAAQEDVLVITYVGFIKQEITASTANIADIILEFDVEALDEVIVIGYGTQRKSDITGSVASIRKSDMNPGPVVSVSNLLQSTAPGVVLTQSSSQPGGGFDVKIRGASSVLGANGPLYVIDGFPVTSDNVQPGSSSRHRSSPPRNPLNGINPKDIVSIEILKDASATAIYGARGANGVVLITTKRGSGQKFKLDYSSSFSLQHLNREYEMLNADEYARISNEVFLLKNPGEDPIYSAAQINNAGVGTNWIDQVTRLGTIHQQQIGGSGGYKNLKYYVSTNYFQHRGIVDISELKRFGGRANLDYSKNKVNTGLSVSFSQTNDKQVPFGANSNAAEFGGLFDNTRNWSPLLSVRDDNGEFTVHPVRSLVPNPVSLLNIDDQIKTSRILGTAFFEYELVTGLKAKINLGRDQSYSEREALVPLSVIRGEQANGEGEYGETDSWSSLGEFTLTYDKKIGNGSRLTLLGGTTFQQFDSEGNSNFFVNFADQTTDFSKITNADTLSVVTFKERSKLLSYLGRINYSINDRYLLTFTFRADGSTKFGPNNKWGYFPSGAVAWKIHNEKFFTSSFIEKLKLRASYGQIGNQEIGNKRSQSLYNVTRRTVIGGEPIQGFAALRPDNPDLKWETTTQLNLGLDFAVLENRIYGSVDVYEKTTTDVLLDFQLPGTAGFDAVTVNAGSITNRGIEFALTSRNIVKEFQWTSSLNFSYNKNQWKDRAGFYPEGQQIARENGPLSGIYGYKVLSLFQSQDEIDNSPDQSAVAVASPGTFKYADANDDGTITPEDRVLLGQYDPKYTFGINNTFTFKGFDFNFFFQGSLGKRKMNFTRAYLEDVDDITEGFNKSSAVLNRWTPENPLGTIPGSDNILGGFANNDRYIEDASFVRLRNITLGYTFNEINKVSNLRLYADVQNLITITPFEGNDPETDEFSQYPNAKTYTIGLSATF
jgi:TonB-linked SusC/RagA family outer membrane protein